MGSSRSSEADQHWTEGKVVVKSPAIEQSETAVDAMRDSVKSEEILTLLEDLRADEEDHLACLLALLHKTEAHEGIVTTGQPAWIRSVGRMISREGPAPLD